MEAGTIPPPVPVTVANNHPAGTSTGTKSARVTPSIFIIASIVAIAIISILFIHRLLRFFFHNSHGSSYRLSIAHTSGNVSTTNANALSEHEKLKLIDALPLIRLASNMAKLPKSSLDCAVCCEAFLPDAELRLLPACRHAFHQSCVDKWLKSNPSCPLCRSSITLPHPPLPDLYSGSFRLELGTVSFRRSEPNSQVQNQIRPVMPPSRTYSLESHDYCIEEEVEIAQHRVTKPEKREIEISDLVPPPPPPPPPPSPPPTRSPPSPPPLPPPPPPPLTRESMNREEPVRGWLQEYLDRLASSASSSFNSMRFPSQRWSERWSGRWSQRSSQRFDSVAGGGLPPDTWLWDLEAGQNEEAGGALAVYRWLTGL